MKEKHSPKPIAPGLEESLHPDLANGALWEENLHSLFLRSADPSKSIESRLLDESTRHNLLIQWTNNLNQSQQELNQSNPVTTQESVNLEAGSVTQPSYHEESDVEEIKDLIGKEEESELGEAEEQKQSGSGRKGKKAAVTASKRIRKVAEKARQEESEAIYDQQKAVDRLTDSSLSPFTQWIKGLAGSEYVHPYGDDFAIDQGEHALGEGISETFADLLASQGYKDQAIAMYQKLAEKFPEKSRFFAAKIEAL